MAHGWNPYLHSFSSLPSDHGTTDPEVRHPAVPPPGDDFIAHGGFSRATISHGASASNTNYFFSNSSGNNISSWGSEIGNAQRNYREMTWQPDGEQKAYLPRWDNSNFGANVLETAGHCSVPTQLGRKPDPVMPKGSQYFKNSLNNQGSSDHVHVPKSSCEFMTSTSGHNSQSEATPGYHSQWHQRHTDNATISPDRRYSNMWPNLIAENATKYVQDMGKSSQPGGIAFANSLAYTNSETGHFDNTSKQTFVNMCQNANVSENYDDIDTQTMMNTSETNKTKHLDLAIEAFTDNQGTFNPKQVVIFSDSSRQENDKDDGPSQSSSQSSVSNDLVNSDASLTDVSEASNDSQPSIQTSAVSGKDETADCSPHSQGCPAAYDANSDSNMHPESYMDDITEIVGKDPAAPSIEVSAFSTSSSCDPSTLNAGDKKDESNELAESNVACKSVCAAAAIDKKPNMSGSVNLATNVSEILNQPNGNELLGLSANASINPTNVSNSVDSALNVTKAIDQKNSVPDLFNSDSAAYLTENVDDKTHSDPLDFHSAAHVTETIEDKTNQSDPADPESVAHVTETDEDKNNASDLADTDSAAHVTENVDNKTESDPLEDRTNERDPVDPDSAAYVTETIEDRTNASDTVDPGSATYVTENLNKTESDLLEDRTNVSDPVDPDSAAHVTETIENKTERDPLDLDSTETIEDRTNASDPVDPESASRVTENVGNKTESDLLEDKTNASDLADTDSDAHVTEKVNKTESDPLEDRTNESDPVDPGSAAHVTETIKNKTECDPLDLDSAAYVTETIEDRTNASDSVDPGSVAHVTENADNKTERDPVDLDLAAHVTETIEDRTNASDTTDPESPAQATETTEDKTNENDPLYSATNVTYNKDNGDHTIKAVKNEQQSPEKMINMSNSDHVGGSSDAASASTATVNELDLFDSETRPAEDSLNKMQEKETTSSFTTPIDTCDKTLANGIEHAFSNLTMDKEPQLIINPEEKLFPKMKIKQEFIETSPNTSEMTKVQDTVENFPFLKSEFSEQKISDEEHLMWDDYGKPLTPSSSEMDESVVSPEMKPSTKMAKRLQPIVLIKTTELTHLISGKYICAQCMHITSSVDDLIEHQSLQHPMQPFQLCKSCGVYLVHQDQSRQHLCGQESVIIPLKPKRVQRQKKFCKKCGLHFGRRYAFISHMRTHTGVTPYKCEKCGLYFAQSSTLNRHRTISVSCGSQRIIKHCGPKKTKHPLKSMVSCYVKLYDISKGHSCKFCGKCFTNSSKLNKHFHNVHKKQHPISKQSKQTSKITEVMSEKRKYKCPLCPMTFSHYMNRNSHLKACVKESVFGQKNRVKGRYKCPLCLATFTLKSNRYRHLYTFCLRNFLLFLGKDTSKPVKYPRYSKQMKTVLSNLKAEEEQLNSELSENVPCPKSEPRFQCTVCQAVFRNKSSKYRCIKRHRITGNRFKYRLSNSKSITLSPMTDTKETTKLDTDSVKCKYCEKSFASSKALKKHEFTHKGDRPYYCSQCGKGFKSHVVLIQHKITHQRRIQCTVCKKILPTIGELIQHRTSHTNRGMLQCPDCPRQFTFPVFLLRHLRCHLKTQNKFLQQDPTDSPPQAPNTDHPCPFCSQVFDDAKLLRKHYLTHIPKSSLQCPFCKRKFTIRRYLLRHIALHVGSKHLPTKNECKEFICRFCSRPFINNGHLMKHYKGHSRKTLIRCTKCNFFFGISKYSLHKKVCKIGAPGLTPQATNKLDVNRAPSAETKLRCQHCSETFKYPSLYRRHLLKHKDKEVHACILCGQNFPSLALCSLHEASCDDLYKCKESINKSATRGDVSELKCKFCNKTFTKARNLRCHILTHNEVKPYRCKACESSFSRYDHLKVHLGRCLGKEKLQLKPQVCIPKISLDHIGTGWQREFGLGKQAFKLTLECKICARTFATQSKLNWHNSMFHTVKRLKCMQCGTFFSHEKSLQNHIRYRRCRLANIVKGRSLRQQAQNTKEPSSNKQNVLLTRILPTSTEQKATKTLKCNFCFRTFRSSAHLKVHTKLHCENSFACDCGKRFFKKAKLQRHITTCVRKGNKGSPHGFSCAYCSCRFLLFSQLQEHFLTSHKLEIKDEPVDTAPLQQHLFKMQHSEEKPDVSKPSLASKLVLPFEGKKSPKASELRECPYPCKICSRGFWNKTLLRNHFRKCRRSSSCATQPKEENVQLRADINMVLTDSEAENSNEEVEDTEKQDKSSQEKKTAVYQCSECDKSFTDGLLLISHLEAHGREEQEKRLNKCPKCARTFLNQARLEKHMRIHETLQLFCKDCSTELLSETELENHRKQYHDPSAPYSCQICHYRFKTRTSLADHCSKNHPNNIFPCHICNRIYTLRASLIRHNKNHHGQEMKEGAAKSLSTQSSSGSEAAAGNDDDDGDYNNEDDDDDDDDDHHGGSDSADSDSAPYFPCHVCGKTFTTSESLEDHQRCHLGEKPYECAQCGQCFFQAGQLQQHERKHKSEFQCRVCGRGFLSLFALRKHKHTSGKKRPFRCKKCPLYFTSSALLADHMLCHREESFPCDICNRVFPSKSSRADHRKIHLPKSSAPGQPAQSAIQAGNKPAPLSVSAASEFKYRCGVCCLRFRNPEELSEHGCLAGTERQYSCVDCDKHFLHSSHLKKHLLTHKQPSSQSKYPCNQCNKSFSSPQDFLNHLKNHEETANCKSSQTGFVCPICHQCFTRSAELAFHFPSHQSGTLQCKICKKSFLTATQLKEHKACHSKDTKCKKCGQIIQGTNHECAARHVELMNIVSSFAEEDEIDVTGEDHCFCPFCPMQFSSRSNLLEHQNKQHPNEKSYSCKICARSYPKQKYLDKHIKKHHQPSTNQSTSQISFKCTQCHSDFNSAKDLSVHLKLHAAEKEVGEYRCDMCYKSFSQLQLLRRHQESHVGQIVYECTECDKAFAFPHLLEEHQKSHV